MRLSRIPDPDCGPAHPSDRGDAALPLCQVLSMLRAAGLRPTRRRVGLGSILFRHRRGHVSARELHRDALARGLRLSLGTVYKTLRQFAGANLVRSIAVGGNKTYFDTNTGNHQHFYVEAEDRIVDIPAGRVSVGALPSPPEGYELTTVDVVLGLRRVRPADRGPTGKAVPSFETHLHVPSKGTREPC